MKLHLGCGTTYLEGWINIDIDMSEFYKVDLKLDIRQSFPYKDNSIDFIYNEHLIEHLTDYEGVSLLKECLRVIKPGGIVRVATFDLDDMIKNAQSNNPTWKFDLGILNGYFSYIQTRAEYFNVVFYSWGHKWLYNTEELRRRFKEAGFSITNMKSCKVSESEHEELKNLETRPNSTVIIEGTK